MSLSYLTSASGDNIDIHVHNLNYSGQLIPNPGGSTGPTGPTGQNGAQGSTGPTGPSGTSSNISSSLSIYSPGTNMTIVRQTPQQTSGYSIDFSSGITTSTSDFTIITSGKYLISYTITFIFVSPIFPNDTIIVRCFPQVNGNPILSIGGPISFLTIPDTLTQSPVYNYSSQNSIVVQLNTGDVLSTPFLDYTDPTNLTNQIFITVRTSTISLTLLK